MADLTDNQAAQTIKIVGSDSAGIETNTVGASAAGRLFVDVAAPHTVSSLNSTSIALGIGVAYIGTFEEILNYSDVSLTVFSDKDSATNGLVIQWSSDGTNVDYTDVYSFIAANGGNQLSFGVKTRYFRVIYKNGSLAQVSFRLQTILHPTHTRNSTHRIGDSIYAEDDSELVKSTIIGRAANGNYYNVQVDDNGRLVISAITGFGANFVFGDITTTATTKVPLRRTAYTEQTVNAQREMLSSSVFDTAANIGARTVLVTYYDQTGAGPFTETVTLNGTGVVLTTNTNICFIEKMEVITAGSTGSNVGTITIRTIADAVIGTIAPTNNQTFWAHHYVATGKIANITGISCGHTGTAVGSGALFTLNARPIGVANAIEKQVSDFVRLYGQSSTFARSYVSPLKISGPARLNVYVTPETSTSTTYRCAVDFFEP